MSKLNEYLTLIEVAPCPLGTDDNEEREDAEGESAPPPTPISTPPAGGSVSTTDVPVPRPTTNVTDGPVSEHQARDIALDYAVRVAGDTHITCTVRLVHNGIGLVDGLV